MLAFLLLGLAVVHYVTRSWQARGLILFGTYIAVIFHWLGIADHCDGAWRLLSHFAQIRRRMKIAPS